MQLQTDAAGVPVNATMIPQGDDRGLVVMFYNKAEQNNFKSTQEGRPIFDEIVFIRILVPGDRTKTVERPCREDDKQRFPMAWANFKNQVPASLAGTPVQQWPRLSVSQVAEAFAGNIFTVEAIGELSDQQVSSMGMGWSQLRTEAKAFIAKAADGAIVQRLASDLSSRDEKILALENQVRELGALVEKFVPDGAKVAPAKKAA